MIRAILFDKDGTLTRFRPQWRQVFRLVFERLGERWKLPADVLDALRADSGFRGGDFQTDSVLFTLSATQIAERWAAFYARRTAGTDVADGAGASASAFVESALAEMDRAASDPSVPIEAEDGVPELLAYLRGKGYRLGVATADTARGTELCLKRAGIGEFFEFVGTDGVCRPKPDPQMAESFLSRTGLRPDELLIVGDSPGDLLFARRAGAWFAGIRTEDQSLPEDGGERCVLLPAVRDLARVMRL